MKGLWMLRSHLLDLQARDLHTADDVWKQGHHIVVAHGHVRHHLLQGNLLCRVVLIALSPIVQLQPQLRDFALCGTTSEPGLVSPAR